MLQHLWCQQRFFQPGSGPRVTAYQQLQEAGAIVGAFGFLALAQSQDPSKVDAGYSPGIGVKNSLLVLGGVNALGFAFTFLVPEPKGRSLEEISGEAGDEDDEGKEKEEAMMKKQFIILLN
ncbi:hypothetical protein K1719_002629 [Acacia pycnantha]|nr:hypothetical protein K1719_002629 [Acacia pycnantha]